VNVGPGRERVTIVVDGEAHVVVAGVPLGAVLHTIGNGVIRRVAGDAPRGIFCGMGMCFDCLVTIDGHPGVRACITSVRAGMRIERERAS
jgi:predicted molibdopterin-dependent oxidoreductase YjgC